MWVQMSMWNRTLELGVFDHWVITSHWGWAIAHWLESGFVRVPEERILLSVDAALAEVRDEDVPALWEQLFESRRGPAPDSVYALAHELVWAARAPIPEVIVLERLMERGFRGEPFKWEPKPLPPRSETEHYIVVEAVGADERPVAGLRLELLIADGEVKPARTDREGITRVERIQAGRVVIRVLDLDGEAWRPLEGDAAQPSASGDRLRTHVVKRGECLSKIALQYGVHGWKRLWEHAGNESLRQKRKSPHVLLPGDQVTIPGIDVHEIIRPTDQTHRIKVTGALVAFRVILQDHNQLPYKEEAYELRLGEGPNETPRTGKTDDKGKIMEQLPAGTRRVEVFLPRPRLRWAFELGSLLAIPDEKSLKGGSDASARALAVEGMQTRLLALGFPCGPADGQLGPRTRAALSLWQGEQENVGAASVEESNTPEERLDHALLARLDDSFEVVT
jgi:hypothetical protein